MRLLTFKEFLKEPSGTIYSTAYKGNKKLGLQPNGFTEVHFPHFEDLAIKWDTLGNSDFVTSDVLPDPCMGHSMADEKYDEYEVVIVHPGFASRWAMYEEKAMFWVYDKEDREMLAEIILDPFKHAENEDERVIWKGEYIGE